MRRRECIARRKQRCHPARSVILARMTHTDLPGLTARIYRLGFRPSVMTLFAKAFYPLATRSFGGDNVPFLNDGYEEDPPMAVPLAASDEPNRFPIQLYHRTATQADLKGKRVLEVSCGHGGGASYLVRTLHPASYTGLDLNASGVAFCRKTHNLPGLDFVQGHAENLPFDDQSFDAVINVEASHCYLRFPRFLTEVARVLRPGGHFLYTDLRGRLRIPEWEAELAAAPMRMVSHAIINAEVLRAIDKNAERSLDKISRLPVFLRPIGREFVHVPASRYYCGLQSEEFSYRIYCFAKPESVDR
jgi:ubiquinone/menaquinone biosynthesis C-methylase UbiE